MADIKISALPGASTLDGTETIPLVQGGTTKKATVSSVWTMVNPSYTGTLTGGTGVVNLGSGQFVKDASGNLGLGVTPSAWNSNVKALQFGLIGSLACRVSGEGSYLSSNVYYSGDPASAGSGGTYMYSVPATSFLQADGFFKWFTAPSGTAGNPISFTQAMTLDANGTFLLEAPTATMYVRPSATANNALARFVNAGGTGYVGLDSSGGGISTPYALNVWHSGNYPIVLGTSGTERARIDASGNLLVGTTSGSAHSFRKNNSSDYALNVFNGSASNPLGVRIYYDGLASGGNAFLNCIDTGATRLIIAGTGNVTNVNNSYGAISDAKLKDNITDVNPKLAKLMQVRIVNYTLKSDPDKTKLIGVVAQELEKVSPGLIEETKDFEDVKKTREVTKSVPVTEQVTVQREQKTVEVVDGKAVVTVTLVDEQTAVPVVDHYPLFDADGQPVLEVDTPEVPEVLDEDGNVTQPAAPATYRQALHSVPRMRDVTETEEYTERVPLGTVTKSVKYSVFVPMLVKAVQEQQAQIEALSARLAALEAK